MAISMAVTMNTAAAMACRHGHPPEPTYDMALGDAGGGSRCDARKCGRARARVHACARGYVCASVRACVRACTKQHPQS